MSCPTRSGFASGTLRRLDGGEDGHRDAWGQRSYIVPNGKGPDWKVRFQAQGEDMDKVDEVAAGQLEAAAQDGHEHGHHGAAVHPAAFHQDGPVPERHGVGAR